MRQKETIGTVTTFTLKFLKFFSKFYQQGVYERKESFKKLSFVCKHFVKFELL